MFALACGDNGSLDPTLTPAASPPATATALEAADCSGEDAAWCAFAREAAAKATIRDLAYFEGLLLPEPVSCEVGPGAPPGCGGPTPGRSVLAVAAFIYGSDCCWVAPRTFVAGLREALDQVGLDMSSPVAWEPYAVLSGRQHIWPDDTAILLKSAAPTLGIIELGLREVDGEVRVLGMIAGNSMTFYADGAILREIR
jgi:hypothetical protein